MSRKNEIKDFEIFLLDSEWRARMSIFSTIEHNENFNADINLPIENYNTTPEEIKKEIFDKLRKAFIEITDWLKKQPIQIKK